MMEFLFLPITNNLPRLRIFDRIRYVVYQWAGLKIQGQGTIWGPLTIRPIGGAKNIKIGKGSFLNTEIRFGVPYDQVVIGENVEIGPRVMFETVSHGLRHVDGQGRGAKTKPIIIENEVWIGGGQ